MSKYNSKKVECDGIVFDSILEKSYYLLLKEKKLNNEIKDFKIQPKYELIPKFEKFGIKHRSISYTPDFWIWHNDDTAEVIDVKGFGTSASDLRRKLFDFKYSSTKLTWLSYCKKYGGWLEYDELLKIRRNNKKEK